MAQRNEKTLSQVHRHRRTMLTHTIGFGLGTAVLAAAPARGEDGQPTPARATPSGERLLRRPASLSSLETRAKIVLEVQGKVRLEIAKPDAAKPEVKNIDLKSKSTLDYFEKAAFAESQLVAVARRYNTATAENWLEGTTLGLELRPACSETRMLEHEGAWQQFCEQEPLDKRETELLHSPVYSAALELLLPETPAKPSSSWQLSNDEAKTLFNLEAVHECSVSSQVAKVDEGVATIEFQGEIAGTADSVPTRLQVNGNYQVKSAGAKVLVSWLGLVIKEKREVSLAKPGFEVTARVRLIRDVAPERLEVSHEQLVALSSQEDLGRWLVRVRSELGRFTMLADRTWTTYQDTGEESIYKMTLRNSMIAQCNVTRLAELEAGTQLTLEALQADVQASLKDQFQSFQASSEKVTASGLRMLRCVVDGMAEDVPIQWIYIHLSDDSGRRLAMVFTMGANVTDKFAGADEQMTSSLEFLPRVDPEQPTPAPASTQAASKPEAATVR